MSVVNSDVWWQANWAWMLLWLATALSAVTLPIVLYGARRRRLRRAPSTRLVFGRTPLYLDDRQIMDTYQMNEYAVPLRKEVEQHTTTSGAIKLVWRLFPFVNPEGNYEASRQVVTKYIDEAQAISVIGVIVDALERSNAIVHADLRHTTVRRNAALRKARAAAAGSGRTPARLSATSQWFVLLTGDFTKDEAASTATATVFTAPYAPDARVRISCLPNGFRSEADPDTDLAPALCLGKVRGWRPGAGVLDVRPLAIFS